MTSGGAIAVTDDGVLFLAYEGANTYVFVVRPEGTPPRKALSEPVVGLRRGVSRRPVARGDGSTPRLERFALRSSCIRVEAA